MRLEDLVREEIAAHTFPGCVIGISHMGERKLLAFGTETYDSASPEITLESVYDLASVTKTVTATLAHQLIDENRFSLDDLVNAHIPEYEQDAARIRHLLTYTLGNRMPLARLADLTPEAIIDAVCSERGHAPGKEFSYSNAPAFLLGLLIERSLGISLARSAAERIFEPLEMHSTTFTPRGAVPSAEGVRDIPHDESARVFAQKGRAVGHAGLFSAASDLLTFLEYSLVHADDRHTTNHIPGIGTTALGWELDQAWMGERRTPQTYGKTGFTGTSVLVEPENVLAVVILSNRTYPRRPHDQSEIMRFRRKVHDSIRA